MEEIQKSTWNNNLKANMEAHCTEDLIAIWKKNDRKAWTNEAFAVIREILLKRIGNLPEQDGEDVMLMEATELDVANYFDRVSVQVYSDGVVVELKNLLREMSEEYAYSELRPRTITGKTGKVQWTSLGWSFIAIDIIAGFTTRYFVDAQTDRIVMSILGGLTVLAFLLRLIKYEYIWFYTNKDEFAFAIRITPSTREHAEKVADFIVNKTIQANAQTATKHEKSD